ncbi:MAG: hypothetical protein IT493_12000 [Gammaproteobacteria bacterium]|nr:hypothetical protein [Gammaproteobacteria bacterium]
MEAVAPGLPAVPAAPSPDQGAQPDAPNAADPSAGNPADPQGQPQPGEDTRPAQDRINELTFHRRRAERVAAEAIQENHAMRAYLAQIEVAQQAGQQRPNGQQQPPGVPPQDPNVAPRPEDYSDWPSFVRAQAQHEYRQMRAAEQAQAMTFQQAQQQAFMQAQQAHEVRVREATLQQVVEAGNGKYADFTQVVSNPQLPSLRQVHPAVLDAVTYSDHAGDILYYLGKNAAEAQRIASLNPVSAVREIGRLEAKIAAGTVQISAVPPPPGTVQGRTAGADPLSDRSSINEWMAARNRQVRKGK